MIYESYFSLSQRPFTIAPNPQFLYDQGQYQEALAALEFGMLHRGGFVLLTGEVGTGKTTLCKHLLQRTPENTEVALILHPQLDRLELLRLICKEFGIEAEGCQHESDWIESITEFLLGVYAKGGYSVLIIDEAQHLDVSVLELIRLLTNLETHEDKLLQIILLGQPELQARLHEYRLRQLNQRFTARYHLNPLDQKQTNAYVRHRLAVAGATETALSSGFFQSAALKAIHQMSGGIPRLINLIADRALMGAYAMDKHQVTAAMVKQAAKEVLGDAPVQAKGSRAFKTQNAVVKVSMAAVACMAVLVVWSFSQSPLREAGWSLLPQSLVEETCEQASQCWQGRVPIALLRPTAEVKTLKQGQWLEGVHTQASKGLVLAQISVPAVIPEIQKLKGAIKLGDVHELVPWVRSILQSHTPVDNLAQFEGWQMITPDSAAMPASNQGVDNQDPYFDVMLEQKVKQFQREYDLVIDGVVGEQTLVSLKLFEQQQAGL